MATDPCSGDAINTLTNTLRVQISAVSPEAVELELANAIREFCVRTNAWVEHIDFPTQENTDLYSIDSLDNKGDVSAILAVTVDGRPISGWSGDYQPPDNLFSNDYLTNPDQLTAKKISFFVTLKYLYL